MICIDYDSKKRKGIISGDEFDVVREHFSVENPAAKFNRYRKFIAKRLYAITPTGQFDVCLLGEIQAFLWKQNTDINITDAAQAVVAPATNIHNITYPLALQLRDYQQGAIELCVQQGRGVVVMGTGAGKTLTCATLIENFFGVADADTFKCLVVVPDLGLVNQTHDDFVSYGVTFKLTKWTGSIAPDFTANVIIANTAILQSRFKEHDWLKYVDVLLVDETHKAGKSTELSKIIESIHTPHKFGFTGTLPEAPMDRWNIIGKIGPVLMRKSSHDLRKEQHLTPVEVKVFNIKYQTSPPPALDDTPTQAYRQELEFIYANTFRNRVISTICSNFNNNALILVNHIQHGEALTQALQNLSNKQVFFIRGEVEVEDRDRVKHIMENNNNVICVAISSIFSTGVNIKNIHMIVFAAGGKSFIRTVQSIGRGLRLHESKEKLIIVDIADALTYGIKHATKRQQIYRNEHIVFNTHNITEK